MEFDNTTIITIWVVLGILFIAVEFFLPGLVTVFLGMGAFLTAIFVWLGIIESIKSSIIVWFTSSLIFAVFLRNLMKRYFPGESKKERLYEDSDAYGTVVEVVEQIFEDNDKGRIRFQGSSWPAMTETGTIEKGKKAKLLYRDNLIWVVEPAPYYDE